MSEIKERLIIKKIYLASLSSNNFWGLIILIIFFYAFWDYQMGSTVQMCKLFNFIVKTFNFWMSISSDSGEIKV